VIRLPQGPGQIFAVIIKDNCLAKKFQVKWGMRSGVFSPNGARRREALFKLSHYNKINLPFKWQEWHKDPYRLTTLLSTEREGEKMIVPSPLTLLQLPNKKGQKNNRTAWGFVVHCLAAMVERIPLIGYLAFLGSRIPCSLFIEIMHDRKNCN
jgi:hypothetical protein